MNMNSSQDSDDQEPSKRLEELLEGRIEIIDDLELDKRKVYWLKGNPSKSNKNLLILYQDENDPLTFTYDVVPYSNPIDIRLNLSEGLLNVRNLGKGGLNLNNLSELAYLKDMKYQPQEGEKPAEWPISDNTFLYFRFICEYVVDKDIENADIVIVGSNIDKDAAKQLLVTNYYRNHFSQQIPSLAAKLDGE